MPRQILEGADSSLPLGQRAAAPVPPRPSISSAPAPASAVPDANPTGARGGASRALSCKSLPDGWLKIVRQGRTKRYAVYRGPDGHVCESIPAVHRYLSSGEGTRRSTTARARQAPASAEVARCGHTDPADGIPGMPPPGSRCGACRQGCTVVSTNGFHEGLCSHMVVQGPLDVGPKLGRRSSSPSFLRSSPSFLRSIQWGARLRVRHVLRRFRL